MHYWNITDRAVAPNRSGNQSDDDEKVVICGLHGQGKVTVRFADGEKRTINEADLLVDQDHQTLLSLDKLGNDHLVGFNFEPNAAIDPKTAAADGVVKLCKLRLDVLCLIVEAVSEYPNTGAAIDVLIANLPMNDAKQR
jgi:hypothetical protein